MGPMTRADSDSRANGSHNLPSYDTELLQYLLLSCNGAAPQPLAWVVLEQLYLSVHGMQAFDTHGCCAYR